MEIIASYFHYGLKMMSRNTLSVPQPDSASYLLLISMADTAREILSRLGHWVQVLAALNPVDPLHNCMFE